MITVNTAQLSHQNFGLGKPYSSDYDEFFATSWIKKRKQRRATDPKVQERKSKRKATSSTQPKRKFWIFGKRKKPVQAADKTKFVKPLAIRKQVKKPVATAPIKKVESRKVKPLSPEIEARKIPKPIETAQSEASTEIKDEQQVVQQEANKAAEATLGGGLLSTKNLLIVAGLGLAVFAISQMGGDKVVVQG